MGIAGLHALIKPIMRRQPIAAYRGAVIGVDGHSWLHQVISTIAYELFFSIKTEKHVGLFLNKVKSLKTHGIVPVIVFDGDFLESKEKTNRERAALRERYANEAAILLQRNETARAREVMKRCVSITPDVFLSTLNALKANGIEYLISPYEADAQLTFLQKTGYVDYVLSEDSDLIPYGCSRVLYKYNGSTVEEYHADSRPMVKDSFFWSNILDICILGGCDYLSSIRGVGINIAYKKLKEHREIRKFLSAMQTSNKQVPEDYIDGFVRAKLTFMHHIVYDPASGKRVNLNPTKTKYEFLGTAENTPYVLKTSSGISLNVPRHWISLETSSQTESFSSSESQPQQDSGSAAMTLSMQAPSDISPYFI